MSKFLFPFYRFGGQTPSSPRRVTISALLLLCSLTVGSAQTGHLTVRVDRPGIKISPVFYGLMTEEINHAYDGGLYGELVRNRSFKDSKESPIHWSAVGGAEIKLESGEWPSLRVDIKSAGRGGVANDGFWGIPVRPRTTYKATFYARASADFAGPLNLSIEPEGSSLQLAKARVRGLSTEWKKYTVDLRMSDTTPSKDNRFILSAEHPGTVWLNYVSLFPQTVKNRPNGTRVDLMQKMADLNPAFLRLPGGNYLEGNTIAERFNWKETIGDVDKRPGHQCPWGYRSSDGLGLLEFLEWCEDLRMQPVLAVFAGYALRGEHIGAGAELKPFVQDALDEIEYVTGGTETKWGAVRVENGHPKPFPLTYVEIGNEDQFDRSQSYDGRFTQFYDAIKAKYPKLQIIATMPVKTRTPDVVDDHYYRSAADMERDVHHYDSVSREGPKIFVGEWASTEGNPTPTLQAALGDAAWLTGLERNSDLVIMEAYAPLLVNVNPGAAQWGTNLIGYDSLTSFGSPSFYVQSIFGKNTGDVVLPADLSIAAAPAPPAPAPHGGIGLGTYQTDAEYKDLSVTLNGQTLYEKDFAKGIDDWNLRAGTWKVDEGTLHQTSNRRNTSATAGDTTWTDYTYRVKARKIGGSEGFMVQFHVHDSGSNWVWNVGGWGNTRTTLQRREDGSADEVGQSRDVTVETNRWYDIRIELSGGKIRCYLDDKLVSEADETPRPLPAPMYVAASRVRSTGEVILKVVNVSAESMPLDVELKGVDSVAATASGWVISGEPGDINTVAQPEKIAPKAISVPVAGPNFSHVFPPHSVTVLRIKAKG